MRRNFLAQAPALRGRLGLQLLAQEAQLLLQLVDLLLLAKDGAVELIQQIFGKAEFDLEFGQSGFHACSKGRFCGMGAACRPPL